MTVKNIPSSSSGKLSAIDTISEARARTSNISTLKEQQETQNTVLSQTAANKKNSGAIDSGLAFRDSVAERRIRHSSESDDLTKVAAAADQLIKELNELMKSHREEQEENFTVRFFRPFLFPFAFVLSLIKRIFNFNN